MIAIKILNSTSHYVGVLKAVFKLHFDKSWFITLFVVNDHKPYATPIFIYFFIYFTSCVRPCARKNTLRTCVHF